MTDAAWTEWTAPAKINLYLEIAGRREDGFHDLITVFQALELSDTLRIRRSDDPTCRVRVTAGDAPEGRANLVHRAWRALREHRPEVGGLEVELDKRVPSEAGLGGGSSDAAAALVAANQLWSLGMPPAELERVGAEVGSDVAFFVRGGTQLGEGRGERLSPWPARRRGAFVLARPGFGLSTPEVYRALHGAPHDDRGPTLTPPEERLRLLRLGLTREEPQGVAAGVFNALEEPAFSLRPALADLKRKLLGNALGGALAGSGSALFAYFADEASAERAAREVADTFDFVLVTKPRADGIRQIG
jgi:4-diphosphocytidyl-2-C-methyl-D-erythritol kinase